jgi:hypothetical protein
VAWGHMPIQRNRMLKGVLGVFWQKVSSGLQVTQNVYVTQHEAEVNQCNIKAT